LKARGLADDPSQPLQACGTCGIEIMREARAQGTILAVPPYFSLMSGCSSVLAIASACACILSGVPGVAETTSAPTAESIMAQVAAHQDMSEAARSHYVYVQHSKVTSRRGRTVMCEEFTDYRVTPAGDKSHEELLSVNGRLLVKHKYVPYTNLLPDDDRTKAENDKDSVSITIGGDSADRNMVEHMRKNLLEDESKDGINAKLFPLTSKAQADYEFHLEGREHLNGRDVFHLRFRPKDKKEFGWSGDAWIDATAFQPVLVTTGMARKIPFAVRTLLGTNLPGLGFTVAYAPQADGVWFPVTFSTEFKIEVLFFFRREIIIDAQNREFEMTHVTSKMLDDVTPVDPQKP